MTKVKVEDALISLLVQKSQLKQSVFDTTKQQFVELKEILQEITHHFNDLLNDQDKRIKLEFHDKGEFVAMIKVGGDALVFSMHTNAFQFDRGHEVWKNPYVTSNPFNSYVGQIQIYNFLNDSFKYNRNEDLGYLVARIFINREKHFFVEGKQQKGTGLNNYGKSVMTKKALKSIVEMAIVYSLQFDLLVQPYDNVKIISLMQVNDDIMNSRMQTGKRLGFQYNSDDVNE